MNLWQAIKMAVKSLFSNKLRSFLTMLGIIIGVFTVSLLTTVASGVQAAVVSQIRSQSTLAVMTNMNTTGSFTVSKANEAILQVQPESEDAEDYFDYSIIVASSSVVANESLECVATADIGDYLIYNEYYDFTDEELAYWLENDTDKYLYATMLMSLMARSQASETSIYATSSNFLSVYSLDIEGRYPETSSEVAIDEEFAMTYFPNYTFDEILGKNITLGVELIATEIVVKFDSDSGLDTEILSDFVTFLSGGTTGLGLTVQESKIEGNSIVVTVDYYKNISNSRMTTYIKDYFEESNLEVASVEIEDIYDDSSAKVFTVVGIISGETNSFFSMSVLDDGSNEPNLSKYMSAVYSSSSGTCYVLLGDENLPLVSTAESVDDASVSYIYFKYKSEDVMSSSISSLTVAFALVGLYTMVDFFLISMSSVANIISNVMDILTVMLTVISVISLIIGGIGIMNIMLVAVTERTREIGIRKAIGAKKSSILTQFLVEALMLSLIGGAIGLIIAAIGSAIIGSLMSVAMAIPAWVVVMSLGFCTAIGLIFGMFPAVKASNMQPIDALRRE